MNGEARGHCLAGGDLMGGGGEHQGVEIGADLRRRAGHLVAAAADHAVVTQRIGVDERPVGSVETDGNGLGLAEVGVADLHMREGINRGVVVDRLIGDRAGDRWWHRDSRRDNACCVVVGTQAQRGVGDQDGKLSRHGVAGRDLMGGRMEDEGIQIRRHLSRRAGHRVDAAGDRTVVSRRVRVGERAVGSMKLTMTVSVWPAFGSVILTRSPRSGRRACRWPAG